MTTPRAYFSSILVQNSVTGGQHVYVLGGLQDLDIVSTVEMLDVNFQEKGWLLTKIKLPAKIVKFGVCHSLNSNEIWVLGGIYGDNESEY